MGAGRTKLLILLHAGYSVICLLITDMIALLCIFMSNLVVANFPMMCIIMMQDTFRGRVCECPTVQGVKFVGDGYSHCEGT